MAKPQKNRPIRFDQFKKQLSESGIDELQEIELAQDEVVYIRLGVGIDVEATQEFMERVREAETEDEACLEILRHHPGHDAQEQLDRVKAAGYTGAELIALWGAATADMRDRMGKLRPKRS